MITHNSYIKKLSLEDFEALVNSKEEAEADGYYAAVYELFDNDDSDDATEVLVVTADSESELLEFFEAFVSGHNYQEH